MLRIFGNLKAKDRGCALLALALVVIQVWLDLKLPEYMKQITLLVETPGSAMSSILAAGGCMLLCALGSLFAAVLCALAASRVASDFSATVRERMFDRVQAFSPEEMSRFSTASLITRSTNDITQVQTLIVLGLQAIVKAPIMAVWAITKIAGKSGAWTLATGTAVVLLLIVVTLCLSLSLPRFRKMQMLTDSLNRVTREELTGLRVVRAYNADAYQQEKFEQANGNMTANQQYAQHVMAFLSPSITLISSGLSLAIYWIGAFIINRAQIPDRIGLFSEMVVFSSYAMQVIMSFMMLIMICMLWPRASVSAKRILEVLDTKPEIIDGKGAAPAPEHAGEIEFKNVSFRYPDSEDYVLRDVSFTAKKGETVAFIGVTGCGKTTLVNLIPRFYDATEGEVLVDGENVRDYSQTELRNRVGYISQRAQLFGGTIGTNVAFGDNGKGEFSAEDIRAAIETAQAAEFVDKTENGVDSFVSQGGMNLSGGQRQRLSIARAICRKPEILIFDDSFSALDYRTDRKLRTALQDACAGVTKLIVAQRIGTIRDADRIIVLEDGRVAGIGRHEELMENCDVYRQIAASQYYTDPAKKEAK